MAQKDRKASVQLASRRTRHRQFGGALDAIELGVSFTTELVDFAADAPKSADERRLNPARRVATDWPHLASYIVRRRARPSFSAVCDREGLTDWRNKVA